MRRRAPASRQLIQHLFVWIVVLGLTGFAAAAGSEPLDRQIAQVDPLFTNEPVAPDAFRDGPLKDIWPPLAEPWVGDLDGMIERGKIRILTTFSLGSFFIDRGRPRGVVVQFTERFKAFARRKLGEPRLKVVVIPVRRDQILPFIAKGYGDVAMAQLRITPRRLEQVDFSVPLARNDREHVITGPASSDVRSLDDLPGRTVVVHKDSSYFESLKELNERFRSEGRPEVDIELADPNLETEDLLEMVYAGLLPMTVANDFRTRLWTRVFDELHTNDDLLLKEGGKVGLAIRKDSPRLQGLVDEFVRKYRVGRKIPNVIIQRYRDNRNWVRLALKRNPFRGLEDIKALFKKYGEKYNIDWVLLAAFALQESGFDQEARSNAGAVGIMQVLPSTAADPSVGIKDLHILENNIHAGTRYLSVLRDRFFNDEALTPFQRALFTMAGYNAGPNRINRLRRRAAARGLDPNVWFRNVERVVAAEVGREPVQFVSSIFKYYVAFTRSLAELEARKEARPASLD